MQPVCKLWGCVCVSLGVCKLCGCVCKGLQGGVCVRAEVRRLCLCVCAVCMCLHTEGSLQALLMCVWGCV